MIQKYLLIALIGYLLGSISTGILYSRALGRDIRTQGSKNAGATNMARVHGLSKGLITLLGDSLKGVLATLIGLWIAGQTGAMIGGAFAAIGHMWPVFFDFKGGKGVATLLGVGLVMDPVVLLAGYLGYRADQICVRGQYGGRDLFHHRRDHHPGLLAGGTVGRGAEWALLLAAQDQYPPSDEWHGKQVFPEKEINACKPKNAPLFSGAVFCVENYCFCFRYSSMAAAAFLPAPIARMTVAAPVTASPPA